VIRCLDIPENTVKPEYIISYSEATKKIFIDEEDKEKFINIVLKRKPLKPLNYMPIALWLITYTWS